MASELLHQASGGVPTPQPDVGINITFLILFTICGVFNFETFWRNNKQQRLFAFNAAITGKLTMKLPLVAIANCISGFCSIRIIATSLRIAWAYDAENIHIAMAARIFIYSGTVILLVSNIWWTQRLIRAQHPSFGWSKGPSASIPIIVGVSIFTTLLMITGTCIQFYLSAARAQHAARCIQQYGDVLFAILAVSPIPILLISALAKTHPDLKDLNEDNFGRHCIMRKVLVCLATALLLSIGALFRATIAFAPVAQVGTSAPWYYSKPCFYIFNFTLEILVVVFWMVVRIDKLFIIPNGAWGAHSYAGGFIFPGEPGNEKPRMTTFPREHIVHAMKGSDTLSTRSSTIPPPSRSGSWGSARQYMCASPAIPHFPSPKLDQQSTWDNTSHTRVDSAWGDDSRTGVIYIDTQESVDVQRPAPCMRCLNCGSHEDVNDYAAPTHRRMPTRLGFDPRSAQWISQPMSAPSVSQYSVRETLRPVSTVLDARMSEDASPGSFLGGWAQ